ncbi:MAG: bifunctional phosphoserine phosphatase/homoserine phosphotransferase ThrH [Leptospirales bacterium]|nr:bifunctional phosphoserine phosphatase/homoserine phosphotransferase ThrH [Leptospirales bacterium]
MQPCLLAMDLESCLIPEIWIHIAEKSGIDDLRLTTRQVADYDELMKRRLAILDAHNLRMPAIVSMLQDMKPYDGAREFVDWVRDRTELVLLSDTFIQFGKPIMRALGNPTLFCHRLRIDSDGRITGYALRTADSKAGMIRGLRANGFRVMAAGDSHNDLSMLKNADLAYWFHAPESIASEFPQFESIKDYQGLKDALSKFLES